MSNTTAITIRLSADINMAISKLAKAEHIPKSTLARKFIEERLEQYRIEKAIELYVNEKGSLKEISEITGVPVRRIMGTLRKKNTPLRMREEVFDRGGGTREVVLRVLGGSADSAKTPGFFDSIHNQVFKRSISNREDV